MTRARCPKSDVTRILSQINDGVPFGCEQTAPLVYDEQRKLAAAKMARDKPRSDAASHSVVH